MIALSIIAFVFLGIEYLKYSMEVHPDRPIVKRYVPRRR
jgi:hypothetical protein